MNLTLMFRVVCYASLVVVLAASAPADVITIGDVDPDGATDPWAIVGPLYVGLSDAGTLEVEAGGVVSDVYGYIGYHSDSTGIATVAGTDSRWTTTFSLRVGYNGAGTLNVESGGVVSNQDGYLGDGSGSTGAVTVTGPGSQWNTSGQLFVGYEGNGTLNVESGGVVNSDTHSNIGFQPGSSGEATVTGLGSQWNNLINLHVGNSGTGTLNVTDGGVVTVRGAHNVEQGWLTGAISVGGSGTSTLNITDGGVVSTTYATGYIGQNAGQTGVVTVTGANSQWNNSYGLHVGDEGSGTLNINDGGVVSNGKGTIGRLQGSGEATVIGSGSQWNNSYDLTVDGTLNITDGGVVTNTKGYIGYLQKGVATVTGLGSQWNNSENLIVGHFGTGTLNITDGGVVTNTKGYIGGELDSTGEATVTGFGSQWNNSSYLRIGFQGSGTLNVESGGVVSSTHGHLGYDPGATGVATITGANSQWNNFGVLSVGKQGVGTLNVESGGVVSNTGEGYIGFSFGSTGEVMVTGENSQWNNSSNLYVGLGGIGTLNVDAGGMVSNTKGYIGFSSGSTGEVMVTGENSQWNNSSNLYVGLGGTGTLNIADDGLVTVGVTTSIGAAGTVNLAGGRFEFGQTTLAEFSTINATSGSMAGDVVITGVHDVASLTALQNSLVQLNDVVAVNEGLLYGSAILKSSLDNRKTGEVETMAGARMQFRGVGNINKGEINNFGGQIRFDQDLINAANGFIGGRGQFVADGGWTNLGVMFFAGTTDILGDVVNGKNSQIVTSGSTTTTFYDDLEHNGTEIRTSAGSTTVIGGSATGSGPYTGDGTVYFEGDLRPGNSPGTVSFDGAIVLSTTSTTQIELGGLTAGAQYDQVNIAGTANLNGALDLITLTPYTDPATRGTADDFTIITAGSRSGTFSTVQYDGSTLAPDFETDGDGSFRDHVAGGLFRSVTYTTTVQLQNLLAIEGDTDGDRDVDTVDLTQMIMNFNGATGSGTTWLTGDTDGDGDTDTADLTTAIINFTSARNSAAAVPEPSGLLLLVLAVGCLAATRGRSCRKRH